MPSIRRGDSGQAAFDRRDSGHAAVRFGGMPAFAVASVQAPSICCKSAVSACISGGMPSASTATRHRRANRPCVVAVMSPNRAKGMEVSGMTRVRACKRVGSRRRKRQSEEAADGVSILLPFCASTAFAWPSLLATACLSACAEYKNARMLIVDDFMTTPSLGTKGAIDLFGIMEAGKTLIGIRNRALCQPLPALGQG